MRRFRVWKYRCLCGKILSATTQRALDRKIRRHDRLKGHFT